MTLRGHDLLEVVAVKDLYDVPVVQVEQLTGLPLDIVSRHVSLAADMIAVDRGLVVVEVHHDVAERGGAGCRQRLARASGREAALSLCHVDAGAVLTEAVAGRDGEADRAREPDTGGAGGEAHERRCRGRVTVECPGVRGA